MLDFLYDNPYYYEHAYQVIFLRPDCSFAAPQYEKGIVYHSHVIAARDGKTFSIKKIMKWARKCGVEPDYAIVESFDWIPVEIV